MGLITIKGLRNWRCTCAMRGRRLCMVRSALLPCPAPCRVPSMLLRAQPQRVDTYVRLHAGRPTGVHGPCITRSCDGVAGAWRACSPVLYAPQAEAADLSLRAQAGTWQEAWQLLIGHKRAGGGAAGGCQGNAKVAGQRRLYGGAPKAAQWWGPKGGSMVGVTGARGRSNWQGPFVMRVCGLQLGGPPIPSSQSHLAAQDVEEVGGRGDVDDLPVGVLDLGAQVAAREPVLLVNLRQLVRVLIAHLRLESPQSHGHSHSRNQSRMHAHKYAMHAHTRAHTHMHMHTSTPCTCTQEHIHTCTCTQARHARAHKNTYTHAHAHKHATHAHTRTHIHTCTCAIQPAGSAPGARRSAQGPGHRSRGAAGPPGLPGAATWPRLS